VLKKVNDMKSLKLFLVLLWFGSGMLQAGEDDKPIQFSTTIDPSEKLNDLLEPISDYIAIDFKPIVLTFETGERVPLDYEITVEVEFSTRILKVAEITAELNEIERQLNQIGRSLRDLDEFNILTHIPVDRDRLLKQQQILSDLMRRYDPRTMRELLNEDELKQIVEKAKEQVKNDILTKVRDLVQDEVLPALDLPNIKLPSLTNENKIEIPEFKADKKRTWAFVEGDPKVVAAFGEANLGTKGLAETKSKEASGQVDGKFGVYLMRQPQIVLGMGFANFKSPQVGEQTANAYFAILGKEIYKNEFRGENPKWGNQYSKGVDKNYRFDFPCGPIQCLVTMGARGRVFFEWVAGIGALQAYGSASAGIEASGYAQAEATIGIAGVGAEGELLIIRDTVSLEAHASVRLDDRDMPFIDVGVQANNTIEALRGSLSTYAYVSLPDCRSGSFMGVSYPRCGIDKKKISEPLFSWPGYRHQGNILSFFMKLSPFGYELDGREEDILPEDVRQVEELQKTIDNLDVVERENRLIAARNRFLQEEFNAFSKLGRALSERQTAAYDAALEKQNAQVASKIAELKTNM